MKPLQTTPKQVLQEAILSEDSARAFYLALASRSGDAATRRKMIELADGEIVHRAKLERKYRELYREEPPAPQIVEVEIPDDVAGLDMSRALKLALERERESESNFRFLAERVPGTELGSLFMELAETEWKHKVEIQALYDAASMDPEQFLMDI